MAEKKQELEKRLQDVTGQLGSAKKAAKKGKSFELKAEFVSIQWTFGMKSSIWLNKIPAGLNGFWSDSLKDFDLIRWRIWFVPHPMGFRWIQFQFCFFCPSFSLQLKMQQLANWTQLYHLPVICHQVQVQVIHRRLVLAIAVRAIRVTAKQVRNSNQYTQKQTQKPQIWKKNKQIIRKIIHKEE